MESHPDHIEMTAVSGVGYVCILSAPSMSLNRGNHRNQNVAVVAPVVVRPPLIVKLTGCRLVGLAFFLAALSKFILSLSYPSKSTATNSLDLIFGGVFTVV
jgi:hypothetical protein